MFKKILAILLCFSFLINNCVFTFAGSLNNIEETQEEQQEIEELFAPAVVPVAQAFAYLLALFGVISLNEIYNNNDSSFDEWYNQKILDFKLKCEVLGIGADVVEDWLLSLSRGILVKSSEVWTAFKSWVADLRSGVVSAEPGSAEDLKQGYMRAGKSYNIKELFPNATFFKNHNYDYYYIIPERDCLAFTYEVTGTAFGSGVISFNILIYSIKNDFGNIIINDSDSRHIGYRLKIVSKISGKNETIHYYYSFANVDENSDFYINGIQYDRQGICGTKLDYSTENDINIVPHFVSYSQYTCFLKAKSYFESGLDYTVIGNITDVSGVDIVSPGAEPGTDVNLNWDLLNPGSAVAGVGSGSNTWQDFINSSGLTIEENGAIVGDGSIENPDLDVPETNTGLLGAILTAINGVKTAVLNIPTAITNDLIGTEPLDFSGFNVALSDYFPFCIPFDLVNCINQLNASPVPPKFTVNFAGTIMEPAGEITINLEPMEPLAKIIRFFIFLSITAGIIIVTRNLIRG